MKYIYILSIALSSLFFSCKTTYQTTEEPEGWFNIAVADDVEIFMDTISIRHEGSVAYAREKRVYISPDSKKTYIDKIKKTYLKIGKPEKAEKWNDFSYCIYNCLYECTNKRFRVLSVEDYDSTGKLIIKTITPKNKIEWLSVNSETVGDYTFFYVCDYQQ